MVPTELSGLRCIEHAALGIPPGVVPGCEDHGSGKTSPFEAVFLLGRGRSSPMGNSKCLTARTGSPESHSPLLAPLGIQGLGFQVTWDGASARTPAQRRSRDAPVRVGEVRTHASH